MVTPDDLGQLAYDAYGKKLSWKNFLGQPMPDWASLPVPVQQGWVAAAAVVGTAVLTAMGVSLVDVPLGVRIVDVNAAEECRHCGFLWPPVAADRTRCPGCQQAYDGG